MQKPTLAGCPVAAKIILSPRTFFSAVVVVLSSGHVLLAAPSAGVVNHAVGQMHSYRCVSLRWADGESVLSARWWGCFKRRFCHPQRHFFPGCSKQLFFSIVRPSPCKSAALIGESNLQFFITPLAHCRCRHILMLSAFRRHTCACKADHPISFTASFQLNMLRGKGLLPVLTRRQAKLLFERFAEMCAVFKTTFEADVAYGFIGGE